MTLPMKNTLVRKILKSPILHQPHINKPKISTALGFFKIYYPKRGSTQWECVEINYIASHFESAIFEYFQNHSGTLLKNYPRMPVEALFIYNKSILGTGIIKVG